MTPLEVFLSAWAVFLFAALLFKQKSAYRNGCCDGYGYSKEPTCPGYKEAGEYLTKNMYHRWPELRANDARK